MSMIAKTATRKEALEEKGPDDGIVSRNIVVAVCKVAGADDDD